MTAQVSALPGFLNVIGYGGDDISFTATLKNKDTGAAIPIVGTSKAQIRRYKDDTEYWSMTVAVDPIITKKLMMPFKVFSCLSKPSLKLSNDFFLASKSIPKKISNNLDCVIILNDILKRYIYIPGKLK